MPDKEMSLHDRLAAAKAAKATKPEVPPEPVEPKPTQTMSLSDREFEMLRNQKAAEDRATAAEKKVETLEKSLTHVTDHLSAFVMKQQEVFASSIDKLITPWQIDYAQTMLRHIRHESQVALQLFVSFPQIADAALTALDVDEETIKDWRQWHRDYKAKDHDHWLNRLQDVLDNRVKLLPGQEPFLVAALTFDGIDTKKKLDEIRQERIRIHNAQFSGPTYPPGAQIRRTYDK